MERVLIFQDVANIEAGYRGLARQSRIPARPLDQGHLLGYLSEGRFLIDAFAYLPVDPRLPIDREILGERFWSGGWHVNEKIGKISNGGFKCNMDVEMALDIMELCLDIRPDSVIICSGDEDFLPLVYRLRRQGLAAAGLGVCRAGRLRRRMAGARNGIAGVFRRARGRAENRAGGRSGGGIGDEASRRAARQAVKSRRGRGTRLRGSVFGTKCGFNAKLRRGS